MGTQRPTDHGFSVINATNHPSIFPYSLDLFRPRAALQYLIIHFISISFSL